MISIQTFVTSISISSWDVRHNKSDRPDQRNPNLDRRHYSPTRANSPLPWPAQRALHPNPQFKPLPKSPLSRNQSEQATIKRASTSNPPPPKNQNSLSFPPRPRPPHRLLSKRQKTTRTPGQGRKLKLLLKKGLLRRSLEKTVLLGKLRRRRRRQVRRERKMRMRSRGKLLCRRKVLQRLAIYHINGKEFILIRCSSWKVILLSVIVLIIDLAENNDREWFWAHEVQQPTYVAVLNAETISRRREWFQDVYITRINCW